MYIHQLYTTQPPASVSGVRVFFESLELIPILVRGLAPPPAAQSLILCNAISDTGSTISNIRQTLQFLCNYERLCLTYVRR